jgi:hypothetical protein
MTAWTYSVERPPSRREPFLEGTNNQGERQGSAQGDSEMIAIASGCFRDRCTLSEIRSPVVLQQLS